MNSRPRCIALPRTSRNCRRPNGARIDGSLRLKIAQRAESRSRWWRPSFAWASLAGAGIAVAALILAMVMRPSMLGAPEVDQLALEQPETVDVGLLRNYAVVERLDLLENCNVIEHLDELPSSSEHNHDSRS